MLKKILVVLAVLCSAPALAQTTANQGDGQPSTKKPWRIQGGVPDGSSAATTNPLPVSGVDGDGNNQAVATETNGQVKVTPYTSSGTEAGTTAQPLAVNTTVNTGGKTSEVCVTNAAGGTTITAYAGRRAIELQNLGPNAIFCTVDGQAPLATGALGRKIGAVTDAPANTWALDAGDAITLKCIAVTAAQSTTACTQVTEVK